MLYLSRPIGLIRVCVMPMIVFCRYILMSGEVEVSEKRLTGVPTAPVEVILLGFLADGSFFGEAPVLGRTQTHLELRMRTVTAVQNCELCFLTREDIHGLYDVYPELKARMARFASTGRVLNEKELSAIDLNPRDLKEFAAEYSEQKRIAALVKKEQSLDKDAFVPEHMIRSFTTVKAVTKFKGLASAKRLREREENRSKAEGAMRAAKMEGKTPEAQLAMLTKSQTEMQVVMATELQKLRQGMREEIVAIIRAEVRSEMTLTIAAELRTALAAQTEQMLVERRSRGEPGQKVGKLLDLPMVSASSWSLMSHSTTQSE